MPARKHGSRGSAPSDGPDSRFDTQLLGARSLVGNKLYDAEGNHVGKLEEIVLDVRTGCVRHAIVAVGGFMGIGRRRLAIPWSALAPDAHYCRAVVDIAQMRLTAVRIPDDDPWLRHPVSPSLSTVRMPGVNGALGTGD